MPVRHWVSTLAYLLNAYVLIGGLVSFIGWAADQHQLTDWLGVGISIQPNTTVAVMAAGISLLLSAWGYYRAAALAGGLVALIGASVLFQYITGIDLGIDTLLMFDRTWGRVGVVVPGRMGPAGATAWTILGTSLILACFPGSAQARRLIPSLAIVTLAMSTLSLVGYLYDASSLYTIPTLTAIAFQTATFIFALSVALIIRVPTHGPFRLLAEDSPAGILARRIVPSLIAIPILIGFLRLTGERMKLYDAPFGSALRTIFEIAIFLVLLWRTSAAINRQSRERQHASDALRTSQLQTIQSQEQLEAELTDSRLLQRISGELIAEEDSERLYGSILDAAVSIMRSDFASMQMFYPDRGTKGELRLIAFRGFTPEAAKLWEWVPADTPSLCGVALQRLERVIESDLPHSRIVGGRHREMSLQLGIQAVQSTPLFSRGRKLVGMISTHWRSLHEPTERDLRLLDILARQAADLIERRGAQEALRERENALIEAQRVAHLGSWYWDAESDRFLVSDEFCRIYGLPADRPVPNFRAHSGLLYSHQTWTRLNDAAQRALQTGTGYTIDFEGFRNGERIWLTTTSEVVRNETGAVVGLRGTVQDISERIKLETERGKQEQLLQTVTQYARVGLVIVTEDHRYLYANPSYAEVLGLDRKDLIGRHISEVLGQEYETQVRPNLNRAFDGNRVQYELSLPSREDGRNRRFFSVTYEPQSDVNGSGEVTRVVVVVLDVTEQKEVDQVREQALERESAARAEAERVARIKDDFLATLSHELRTPLNAILGWSQFLKKDISDPEKARSAAEVIERNGRLQAQLITDLLDMSRILTGKMRLDIQRMELPLAIEAAVESILPTAIAKGVHIERVIEPVSEAINGDPTRLQQVVWNLLSNAVKFTPRDGVVRVELAHINSHVEIRVTDSGDGISPAFLPHIFERFRQADSSASRSQGGLGIGLALVKQFVELHGGHVRAASEGKGKGSTFTIELPVAREARDGRSPWSPSRSEGLDSHLPIPVHLKGLQVLVVDDEPDSLAVVKRVLEENEASVRVAASAEEAVRMLGTHSFNLMISDIGMPGSDGYELIRRIRRAGMQLPAIALTAFAREEDRARALNAGYQAHVSKPVEVSHLLATIASLVHVGIPRPTRVNTSVSNG